MANVSISANGARVTTTLTLDKRLPEITMVSPNAVAVGQPATVRVLGRGLSRLAGADAIKVDGVTGITSTVVSDSEATLTLPALPKGRYAISVPDPLGGESTLASLSVASELLPAALVAGSHEKGSLVFDASRNAGYVSTVQDYATTHVQFIGTQRPLKQLELPPEDGQAAFAQLMQMAPDGRTLYIATRKTLLAIDPDTLAVQASYPLPAAWQGTYGRGLGELALTHDLRLWFTPYTAENGANERTHLLAYFDLRTKTFGTAYTPTATASPDAPALALTSGLVLGASGDGTRLVGINEKADASHFVYDAASGRFSSLPALWTNGKLSAVSEDGRTIVLNNGAFYGVQDGVLLPRGTLHQSAGQFNHAIDLSLDGSRVYVASGTSPAPSVHLIERIDVYATNATSPGVALRLIGSRDALGGNAVCNIELQAMAPCTPGGILRVSPLGDSVLWSRFNNTLYVLTIPPALRPAGAPGA